MSDILMTYSEWNMLNEANANFDVRFNSHTEEIERTSKDAIDGFSFPIEIVKFSSMKGKVLRDSVNLRAEMTNGDHFKLYRREGDEYFKFIGPDKKKTKTKLSKLPPDDTAVQTFCKLVREYYKAQDEASTSE